MTIERTVVQLGETANGRIISIVTIEDQTVIREGLAAMIDATQGFRCVGRYASVEEAVEGLTHTTPDVVLTDLGLPGCSGIDGIKLLKSRYPRVLFLVLTVYDDDPARANHCSRGLHGTAALLPDSSVFFAGESREALSGRTIRRFR